MADLYKGNMAIYKAKKEDSIDPSKCHFCHLVGTQGSLTDTDSSSQVIALYKNFTLIANIFPYGEQHSMLIPNRHIHSLSDFTEEEKVDLMSAEEDLIGTYKYLFGSCFIFTREDTPRQTMWHWHRHFCVADTFIPNPVERKEYAPLIELSRCLNAE